MKKAVLDLDKVQRKIGPKSIEKTGFITFGQDEQDFQNLP